MLVTNLDYLLLSHRPDLGQVFLRWTRPATSAEHREGYQAALEMARREKVGRWLIDLRSRGLADPVDFRWIITSFREQLTAALPGVRPSLAYLVLPYHAELLNQRLAEEMATDSVNTVAIRVFTEEQAAQTWLQSK
ncbi:hypothetical protein J0X19_17230 [Hymenobacter sp. BT186]|uniref:STAS/SEC14 domain-containing protein n=1 Tax=Hymenobacter telluris TaxID=2816474 RepID=A0A939EZX0_9BACT|nr:hypothetical protein [Hymenobacter telluris]MBO0359707.1 hypothetical protein [Hymenobacter telluris]MBW3375734.1 hypothetical protein [Hymenobacter norwichensis]